MTDLGAPSLERLQELFDRVYEMPVEEREAEIVRCTAEDPHLAQQLRALLDQAARTDSPLDHPTVRLMPWPALRSGEDIEPPLPQIAGFRLRRRIGRGGSSTVYLADQQRADFARDVALKIVDRVFDDVSLRSVREESRILARLEHPGIARLYDTGVTATGQPWLAIEYVEGETIVDHCRSNRLPLRARIELFLSVLDAVAYAHTKGIVHRDLKPANIFVTKSGGVRLLDFGIAKFCDPADRDETRTLCRALTPAYASPEQIRGERTTPVSDIYSLGIVLYEMLAGTAPKDGLRTAGGDDRETDPRPASAAFVAAEVNVPPAEANDWQRALRGDIDAILGKALRERPEERYATATAMASDLQRVLDGGRVTARREHLTYRAARLVRRHRVAIAISLVALFFAASRQIAGRWDETRATYLTSELSVYRDTAWTGSETRRWLVEGADKLARFDAAGARASFLEATKSSRGRVPDEALAWDGVSRAESSLGEIGRSGEAARRAAALIAAGTGTLPPHEVQRLRARAYAADRDWNRAIATFESLFGTQPERVDIGIDLATTLLACGRTDGAETVVGRLRQLEPERRRDEPGDPRIDLLEAEVALQCSEFQRAAAAATRARDQATRLQAVPLSRRAARVHGEAIGRLDRRDEARRELESIVADDTRLGLDREAAAARLALGTILLRANSADAQRVLEEALAGCTRADDRRCALAARAQLAILTGRADKLQEAIRAARATVADARAIGDRWAEGYALSQLLTLYNWDDDDAATHATAEETLTALRDSGNRLVLLSTLTNLAILANEALELEKAETYLVEAEGLVRRVGSQVAYASIDRARGYLEEQRGNHDRARKSYTSAVERARRAGVPTSVADYLSDLAWLELADDRPVPAAERAKEAIAAFRAVGDIRSATETEGILAWADARTGNTAAARQRLQALQKIAAEDESPRARFDLLVIEARVAAAGGEWKRAIELRRETVRKARGWNAQGLVIMQQAHLAEALHGAGERRALETLVREMLPVAEHYGLRGITRDMNALLASPSGRS